MNCIAHRGASGIAPENTMLGFWTAFHSHADAIEFDVQMTKDKELVIFHDQDLKRILGIEKRICDFSLEELKNFDVGKWKDDRFIGVLIPTLDEILTYMPEELSLVLEIKPQMTETSMNYELETKILNILDDHRSLGNIGYISVRDIETYQRVKEQQTKNKIGLMQKKLSPQTFIDQVKNYNVPISQIRWKTFTKEDISKLKKIKTIINAFYADTIEEWDQLLHYNLDGVLTNFPSLFLGYNSYITYKK